MTIYFVRHGKDDDKYRGGWSNLGLLDEGKNQARLLAEHLHENREKYSIDALISSDLRRTAETAQEIGKKLGMPVQFSEEWREMNNGELAGMLNSEALEKYPGLFFNTLEMDEQYPGGESPREFLGRIRKAYEKLCKEIENGKIGPDVMVVTHGGVINIIHCIANGIEWTNKCDGLCKTSNTGIHIIEHGAEGWKLVMSNNTEHLKCLYNV